MGSAERTERSTDRPGPSADEVAVGTVIAGKYRLDARLGSGGMGTVWACTHVALGERMAVKVVSTPTTLSPEVRSRFSREARATARLKSRFSVQVFDSGELPYGTPYIVMEYLHGETLREHLRRVTRLPLPETIDILSQVARGLKCAHEAGIIHRDIKPDNIFLAQSSDDGVVAKIFDFGVVKLLDAAHGTETVEGTFVGTPQFMSPEQAMGKADVDHRTDIYSLGVLAHRMLTGRSLYEATSIPAFLLQICNGDLPKLRDTLPDLPPDVEAWFQRTCAREREVRFDSAIECVEALLVAAGLSSSRLLVTDSFSSSGLRSYQSGPIRIRGFSPSTPAPVPEVSIPVVVDPTPPGGRVRSLRMVVLGVCFSVVVVAAVLFWRHRKGNMEVAREPAPDHGAEAAPAERSGASAAAPSPEAAPIPAPSEGPPPSSPSGVARPVLSRPVHPSTSTFHPTTAPPPSKRFDQAPNASPSPTAKGASSAITDVGY